MLRRRPLSPAFGDMCTGPPSTITRPNEITYFAKLIPSAPLSRPITVKPYPTKEIANGVDNLAHFDRNSIVDGPPALIAQSPSASSDDSSESVDPDEFYVEAILNKRIVEGNTELLVKWKDYAVRESSWEPIENVTANKLLEEFYKRTDSEVSPATHVIDDQDQVSLVVGLSRERGYVEFVVRYKDGSELIVPSQFAFQRFPTKVFAFLEKHFRIGDETTSGESDYDDPMQKSRSAPKRGRKPKKRTKRRR